MFLILGILFFLFTSPIYSNYYTDDFNRETLGDSWTGAGGSCTISTNKLNSANYTTCIYETAATNADQYVQGIWTKSSTSTAFYMWVRISDLSYTNVYYIYCEATECTFSKKVGGTYSDIGSPVTGLTISSGNTYKLSVSGSSDPVLTLYKDGTQIAQATDNSGTRITAAGYTGLGLAGGSSTQLWDDFEGGTITPDPTPTPTPTPTPSPTPTATPLPDIDGGYVELSTRSAEGLGDYFTGTSVFYSLILFSIGIITAIFIIK